MNIINSIFEGEEEEFFWDEDVLKDFKKLIKDVGIKCCMEDIFLLGFLRATDFVIAKALQMLKNYHDVRLQYPQYFKNLLPSNIMHAISLNVMQFLPKPDPKGRFIYLYEYAKWNLPSASVTDMFRVSIIVSDLQLFFHRTQAKGTIVVINTDGLLFSHIMHLSPRVLSAVSNIFLKDAYQLHYSEIHYVNVNARIKSFLRIFISILPRRMTENLHFHSNMETLHEFVSPECLPSEYGGTLQNFDPNKYKNMILSNEEFFRKNEEYLQLYEEEKARNAKKGNRRR